MRVNITVSALGPSISEQLAAQSCVANPMQMDAEALDRMEHAIHLLRIRGLLTDAESDRAFKRLLREIKPRKQGHD